MRRLLLAIVLVAALVAAAGAAWWYWPRGDADRELVLYGNVDLRQVEFPFNNSERIASVLAREGDRVSRGKVLAELDTSRLQPRAAQAEAQVAAQRQIVERLRAGSRPQEIAQAKAQLAAQQQVVDRLHNGTRPEEIEQARANVESAKAEVVKTRKNYDRLLALSQRPTAGVVSQEDLDAAKAAYDVALAQRSVNEKALDLAVAGPRKEEIAEAEAILEARQQAYDLVVAGARQEEIAEAEARLRAAESEHELLQQQLQDAQLVAPVDSVVRTRLLEPGEMASPQRPVFSLAVLDPKWVRAYVSEPDLGNVRPGMAASVSVDSFPNKRFEGWIGFLSPVAEFTPKTVQTEELRTSLVYEVRVFVKDPDDELRLGMPATVRLSKQQSAESDEP